MKRKFKNKKNPFKWKHFSPDIFLWLVRWYFRYALSYADLQEIAQERGLKIERSPLCQWVHEFGPLCADHVKLYLKRTSGSWKLDEIYVKIKGKWT